MKISTVLICCVFAMMSLNLCAQTPPQKPVPAEDPGLELKKAMKALAAKQAALPTGVPGDVSPFVRLQAAARTAFWKNPEWISQLGLSADQQSRMDDIFQQFRLKLIDNNAALKKEEVILEPMLKSDIFAAGNEAKVLAQIDRIAEARAELEKANSRMILALLKVLTPDQWAKLPVGNTKLTASRPVK
jgi:Spy/CpxP family protein refolding chaperone